MKRQDVQESTTRRKSEYLCSKKQSLIEKIYSKPPQKNNMVSPRRLLSLAWLVRCAPSRQCCCGLYHPPLSEQPPWQAAPTSHHRNLSFSTRNGSNILLPCFVRRALARTDLSARPLPYAPNTLRPDSFHFLAIVAIASHFSQQTRPPRAGARAPLPFFLCFALLRAPHFPTHSPPASPPALSPTN